MEDVSKGRRGGLTRSVTVKGLLLAGVLWVIPRAGTAASGSAPVEPTVDHALTAYYAGDDNTALAVSQRLLLAEPAHPVAQALRHHIAQDRHHRIAFQAIERRGDLLKAYLDRLTAQATEHPTDGSLAAERQRCETAYHHRQTERDRLLQLFSQPVEEALTRGALVQASFHWQRLARLAPTAPTTTQTQAAIVLALQQRLAQSEGPPPLERFLLEGWLAYHRGAFDAATQAWEKARALPPDDPTLAALLDQMVLPTAHAQAEHRAHTQLAERERARQAHAKAEAAQHAAREAAIHRSLQGGMRSYQAGRWREAAYAFQEVLRLAPHHPQASGYLARVQATLARDRDPEQAESHYQAGLVAYAHRQLEQARQEWDLALRLAPDHPKAQRALEKVQKELSLHPSSVEGSPGTSAPAPPTPSPGTPLSGHPPVQTSQWGGPPGPPLPSP